LVGQMIVVVSRCSVFLLQHRWEGAKVLATAWHTVLLTYHIVTQFLLSVYICFEILHILIGLGLCLKQLRK
jgi:hypothetical protein